jgi:hypothetical protein
MRQYISWCMQKNFKMWTFFFLETQRTSIWTSYKKVLCFTHTIKVKLCRGLVKHYAQGSGVTDPPFLTSTLDGGE